MFCFVFELRFVPSKYSLRSVFSLRCQSRRLLSFLLRLFPLFKYKTYCTLFQNLNWLPNYCVLDLGNPTLSYEQNQIIFKHVFEYIKRSERFLVVQQFTERKIAQIITTNPSLSFLSSFSVFVQSTHINARIIYIHACSIK